MPGVGAATGAAPGAEPDVCIGCGAGRWGPPTHSGVGVSLRKPNTVEEQPLIQISAKLEAVSVGELLCPCTGFEAGRTFLQKDRPDWIMLPERR